MIWFCIAVVVAVYASLTTHVLAHMMRSARRGEEITVLEACITP